MSQATPIPLPETVIDPQVGEYRHEIKAEELATGAIWLKEDGADTGVYLYPEQVSALRDYLNSRPS